MPASVLSTGLVGMGCLRRGVIFTFGALPVIWYLSVLSSLYEGRDDDANLAEARDGVESTAIFRFFAGGF